MFSRSKTQRRKRRTDLIEAESAPPSKYNYRSPKRDDISPVAKATDNLWILRLVIIIVVLLLCVLAFKTIVVKPNSSVKVINSNLSSTLNTSLIKQSTDKLIAGSVLNSNKLTFNSSSLAANLKKLYPSIETASVSFKIFSANPQINILLAEPTVIIKSNGQYYLLDNYGVAYSKSAQLPDVNSTSIPVINDPSNLPIGLSTQVLPNNNIQFIEEVIGQLNAKNYTVSYMNLPLQSEELDVYLKGQSYFIKFNLEDNDARQQAGTFLATIKTLSAQHITPSSYIDVRLDGRAYYK